MRLLVFLLAVAAPVLINEPLPPIVSHPTQIAAVFGWGLLMLLAPAPTVDRATLRGAWPLLTAIGLVAASCLASIAAGWMPASPGYAALGIILMAALVALHGASTARLGATGFKPFAIAILCAGAGGAFIAILQVFAREHIDNTLVAYSTFPGRAAGNIGQPNQLADTLLWGLAALVPLVVGRAAPSRQRPLALALPIALAVLLTFGIILSGSRTGLLSIGLLALWGLLDRGLPRGVRGGLGSLPILAGALWLALSWWNAAHKIDGSFVRGSDISAYRFDVWREALVLVQQQPWLGTGWGQFNLAWTLTPFHARGMGVLDNAHDLPLQLAVEMGVPAAALVFGLLLMAAWTALRRGRGQVGLQGATARSALLIVVIVGLHSLLEYPLWYAYLLFPAAWAWGFALGPRSHEAPSEKIKPDARAWRALGVLMMVAAASACLDYLNIVSLYKPTATSLPLDERIRAAQHSPLFSTLGDYAAAMQSDRPEKALPEIERTSRVLLNGRLMFMWANVLAQNGQVDKARFMAARLREFDLAGPKPWFAVCDDPKVTVKPFQCLPPEHAVTWRDFR
jgi:hypothetical protein